MSENTIMILKGPDRVRKRPAVIFGSDGQDGALEAFKTLMAIFIDEASLGYCKKISITLNKDASIIISSLDRGFLIDEAISDGKPRWHDIFCEFPPIHRDAFTAAPQHSELYGADDECRPAYFSDIYSCLGLCCVQYASEFMQIKAVRDGEAKELRFEKGFCIGELKKEPSNESSNTYVHFKLDADVFEAVTLPTSLVREFLNETAALIAGLECELIDRTADTKEVFKYNNGTSELAESFAKDNRITPLYTKESIATGKDRYNRLEYTARVRVTVCFVREAPKILCYHNYRRLELGGMHLECVKEKLERYFGYRFSSALSFEDIAKHIILLIQTNSTNNVSEWHNATRSSISNRMIADMSADLIDDDFGYYLKQNHDAIASLFATDR